jgi:hypothetical protein
MLGRISTQDVWWTEKPLTRKERFLLISLTALHQQVSFVADQDQGGKVELEYSDD